MAPIDSKPPTKPDGQTGNGASNVQEVSRTNRTYVTDVPAQPRLKMTPITNE